MKKLITILSTIAAITMLSSCIIVGTEDEPEIIIKDKTKTEAARIVGEVVGKRAKAKKIKNVVFDRGGYLYTGRVQAVADGARAAGLEF